MRVQVCVVVSNVLCTPVIVQVCVVVSNVLCTPVTVQVSVVVSNVLCIPVIGQVSVVVSNVLRTHMCLFVLFYVKEDLAVRQKKWSWKQP